MTFFLTHKKKPEIVKKLFIQSFSIKRTQHRPKIRISSPLVMTSFYCADTNISTSPLVVVAVNHNKKTLKFFRLFFLDLSYHLNSRG